MNVYEKAQQLLDLIGDTVLPLEPEYTLPDLRYARVGTPVVKCECVQVAAIDLNTDGAALGLLSVVCDDAIQMTTFVVVIARDCAWVAETDGSDDPKLLGDASARAADDAQFLWDWAQHYDEYMSKSFSVGWTLSAAGIIITTLTLTTGVD